VEDSVRATRFGSRDNEEDASTVDGVMRAMHGEALDDDDDVMRWVII
jgi:hypothetical protein